MAVSPHQTVAEKIAEAQKVVNQDPEKAEATYKDVLQRDPGSNDAALRNFETALIGLGELYRTQSRVDDLADLIRQSRSALSQFARAKTSKLGTSISWHSPPKPKLNLSSASAPRPVLRNTRHYRNPNLAHK